MVVMKLMLQGIALLGHLDFCSCTIVLREILYHIDKAKQQSF